MILMKIREHLLGEMAKTDMREEIENALSVLIGQPFWKARRALDMEMLDFGERHSAIDQHGQPIEAGEFALHIQCYWRFTHLDEIVVGSNDLYYPPDGSFNFPEDLEGTAKRESLQDVRLKSFMQDHAQHPLVVVSLEAHNAGAVSIFFTDDYALELFPANSSSGYRDDIEHWRFFDRKGHYFLVIEKGIESSI
jgi:hypothetical protein